MVSRQTRTDATGATWLKTPRSTVSSTLSARSPTYKDAIETTGNAAAGAPSTAETPSGAAAVVVAGGGVAIIVVRSGGEARVRV
nr:unnamed protein product [Digitaria exilis]